VVSDRVAIGGSLVAGVLAVWSGSMGWFALSYNPFAGLPWPELSAVGATLALACAWPAVRLVLGGAAVEDEREGYAEQRPRAEAVRW
jgi:hypothetical protein